MRARIACAALLAAVVPSGVGAQVMTEAEALAGLSEDSPRVRAIRSETAIARASVASAARWPNPRVSVGRESVAGVSETLTTLLQPLPITGRRTLERDSAAALVEATESRAAEALRRARADVRLAYADLAAAQVRERELTRSRNRLQQLAAILGRREEAGDAAGFDRLRSEREAIDVDADRMAASADRARAQGVLAAYLAAGTDPSTLVVEEPAVAARDLPPVAVLMDEAGRRRGDLLALRQELESARLALRAADRRRLPEPEIFAGTKSSSALGGDVGGVIGVQAVLPLLDRGGPERALAAARAAQAEARLDVLRIAARAEIAAWRSVALERRTAADRYRASALDAAADVERIAQVSYDAGERGILELLDAYRTSASARLRQAALDAAARHAEIELEFVSGWEIP